MEQSVCLTRQRCYSSRITFEKANKFERHFYLRDNYVFFFTKGTGIIRLNTAILRTSEVADLLYYSAMGALFDFVFRIDGGTGYEFKSEEGKTL